MFLAGDPEHKLMSGWAKLSAKCTRMAKNPSMEFLPYEYMMMIITMSLRGTFISIPANFDIRTAGDLFFRSNFIEFSVCCLLLAFLLFS